MTWEWKWWARGSKRKKDSTPSASLACEGVENYQVRSLPQGPLTEGSFLKTRALDPSIKIDTPFLNTFILLLNNKSMKRRRLEGREEEKEREEISQVSLLQGRASHKPRYPHNSVKPCCHSAFVCSPSWNYRSPFFSLICFSLIKFSYCNSPNKIMSLIVLCIFFLSQLEIREFRM